MNTDSPRTDARYYIGLDLGQAAQYTALAIVEGFDVRHGQEREQHFHLRHLERFPLRTPYPEIAQRVRSLCTAEPLKEKAHLAVDKTGVGDPVTNRFVDLGAEMSAITITGGLEWHRDGRDYFVPKRDLVSTVQVLLQEGHLKFAEGMALADVLLKELRSFKTTININASADSFEAWREGDHDDLVYALCMACWYACNETSDIYFFEIGDDGNLYRV